MSHRKKFPSLLIIPFLLFTVLFPFERAISQEPRVPWSFEDHYEGAHPHLHEEIKWAIPNLMRQTQIDVSVRLGMRFEEGWRYPLTVKTTDEAPPQAENAMAFVVLYSVGNSIRQDLFINVGAYAREKFTLERVFAHEVVHAMFNDAIGAEAAALLPVWLHEGLAVYGSGEGEGRVKAYLYHTYGFEEDMILTGLEGPPGPWSYAEYFLAILYIREKHGSTALHNFVREVIRRKGDVPGALEYTCFETWEKFQENARNFSIEYLKRLGPPKRGSYQNPY